MIRANGRSGAGVWIEELGVQQSYTLGVCSLDFQRVVFAIFEAVEKLEKQEDLHRNMCIKRFAAAPEPEYRGATEVVSGPCESRWQRASRFIGQAWR